MSFETDLMEGVARLLADNGVAAYDGTPAGRPPIHAMRLGGDPVTALAVAVYPVEHDPTQAMSTYGVQVKARADAIKAASDLAAASFDVLHGRHGLDLATGVRVTKTWHQNGVPLGEDTDGHWVRVDTYHFLCHQPGAHRL